MLEVKVGKGEVREMVMQGNYSEITIDAFTLIHTMYRKLKKANEDVAQGFREAITDNIDEIFDGPEAIARKLESEEEDDDDSTLDELEDKVLEALKGLPESLKEKMLKTLEDTNGDKRKQG